MENVSKALLIAGGVLLTILILTIAVVLYNNYSNTAEQQNKTWSANKIQNVNADYTKYIGRKDISAEEIVTCVNCAKQNNETAPYPISIEIKNVSLNYSAVIDKTHKWSDETITKFLIAYHTYQEKEYEADGHTVKKDLNGKEIINVKNLFECEGINEYYENGQVKSIIFNKI